jgi:hypothetical protein
VTRENREIQFSKCDNIPETESELLDDDDEPVTNPVEEVGDAVNDASDFVETAEVEFEVVVKD